jgi:hypothetical protein
VRTANEHKTRRKIDAGQKEGNTNQEKPGERLVEFVALSAASVSSRDDASCRLIRAYSGSMTLYLFNRSEA